MVTVVVMAAMIAATMATVVMWSGRGVRKGRIDDGCSGGWRDGVNERI